MPTSPINAVKPAATVRPEAALLALFGEHVLGQERVIALGGAIDVLRCLDITEHASRAALKRMTRRGLLHSTREGRRAYLGLTPYAATVLRDGEARLQAPVVTTDWDGRWTLLAFSIPETRRADRHVLRTRLTWAGFGLLKNGLWISPTTSDISETLEELNLLDCVEIFRSEALPPTQPEKIAREAFNIDQLADTYRTFLDRWDGAATTGLDPLPRNILLIAEWLLLIRQDPRLPSALLPPQWPGSLAEQRFRALRQQLTEPARATAESVLHPVPTAELS